MDVGQSTIFGIDELEVMVDAMIIQLEEPAAIVV